MTPDEPESIHYDFRREPTQHEPGETAPIPVSHLLLEHAISLASLLESCEELWSVARHPRADALWPRYRAGLKQHERVLADWLRLIRFYLGEQATPPAESPTCTEIFPPDEK